MSFRLSVVPFTVSSKKSSPPLPPLFHPLENTRANTLLNELFLRESFNFIRWKNSTCPRGIFRCSPLPPLPLFLKVPLTWLGKPRWGKIFPFNGYSFKLRRPTVEKSDQRFSSARSTLSANVQASLMFSHGIIFLFLFLFPSLFIFLPHFVCLFVCLPIYLLLSPSPLSLPLSRFPGHRSWPRLTCLSRAKSANCTLIPMNI